MSVAMRKWLWLNCRYRVSWLAGRACGAGLGSRGLVFTSRWGEPPYPDTVTALMTKLINRHNRLTAPPRQQLPHAGLHDLRHLHATTLLADVPVHVVAACLGHADPAVTLRVYSHVLREHAAGVGDIFARPSTARVNKTVSKAGYARRTKAAFALLGRGGQAGAESPTFRFSGATDGQVRDIAAEWASADVRLWSGLVVVVAVTVAVSSARVIRWHQLGLLGT